MTKHYIIPIFVPHFGCPHDCVFCNQKKITGLSTNITPTEVRNIIEEYLQYFQEDSFIEIAFYGGSFTAIDMDIQSQLLEVPYEYKKKGIVNEIRLSTRPDAIDSKILNNLREYGVNTIELGVQSLDEEVLNNSDRGHSSLDVYNASKLIKEFGFNLGLQMMLGLPSDTLEKSLKTAFEFIKLNPHCIRIYPTLVIKDTYLEKLYLNHEYIPLTLEESIDISTIILCMFYLENLNVIRVGLQPTENIQLGKDVVAGPFHPAYRQLVESNIVKVLLDYYFFKNQILTKGEALIIESNKKNISNLSGQQSSNIKYFREKYDFKKIQIFHKDMDKDFILITIGDFYDKINMKLLMEEFISNIPMIKD